MVFSQVEYNYVCEWGMQGLARLAPASDVIVIVDVLSFTTCVEIATERLAIVFPYPRQDETTQAFAASLHAELAGSRGSGSKYSLSPQSLVDIPAGARLVLPSPNGGSLSVETGSAPTLAGCLRNYRAVATAARKLGKHLAVIPAGERWPDGSLRPALEDWLGAGAILSQLQGSLSPEAQAACAAFRQAEADMQLVLRGCGSGQEQIARGLVENVRLAAALDVSDCVPRLVDGAYQRVEW